MKKSIFYLGSILMLSACSSEYSKQLELAKSDKCSMLAKIEQYKLDSANMGLKEEILSLERMLDTRAELSGNADKLKEEVRNHNCN